MSFRFNIDEILEMAIRIETNWRAFYLDAGEIESDKEMVGFFNILAAMEEQHTKTFERFRDDLSKAEKEGQIYDPEGQASMYLLVIADTHGGEGDPQIAKTLTEKESIQEILNIALSLEKQSIPFYSMLASRILYAKNMARIKSMRSLTKRNSILLNSPKFYEKLEYLRTDCCQF